MLSETISAQIVDTVSEAVYLLQDPTAVSLGLGLRYYNISLDIAHQFDLSPMMKF